MLILLDIDGVMVPASNWKVPELLGDGFPAFHIRAVESLKKILAATNATILLTTSHKALFSIHSWTEIFLRRGINAVIESLPASISQQRRIDEIVLWHHTHPAEKNFVIIDDDKSLNNLPPHLKEQLVLTSSLVGLTDDLADKAIKILQMPLLLPA